MKEKLLIENNLKNQWIVIYNKYEGLSKKAINLINATMKDLYPDHLSFYSENEVNEEFLKDNNFILLVKNDSKILKDISSKKQFDYNYKEQGFTVEVSSNVYNEELQSVIIAGNDDYGLVYGVVDFINIYCGSLIFKTKRAINFIDVRYYHMPFADPIPDWHHKSNPSASERGIWTWGHCIYNYKKFLDNMVLLKLNELVVWNDYAPINAKDVVEYAHSLGIKVIWGFAWGWDTNCHESGNLDDNGLLALKENIIKRCLNEFNTADGIYFQSFTETTASDINGRNIAETVVGLVNDVCKVLLEKNPEMVIQFGLHSQSVKNHLHFIKNVDKRVHIIWENCGTFPFDGDKFSKLPEIDLGDYEETKRYTKEIAVLRGKDDKFGVVLKAMLGLDWHTFTHQKPNWIMGEHTEKFIKERSKTQSRIWNSMQPIWLRYAQNAIDIVKGMVDLKEKINIQGLVEDGIFEDKIFLPVALYANIIWDCNKNSTDLISEVMKYPCVELANV